MPVALTACPGIKCVCFCGCDKDMLRAHGCLCHGAWRRPTGQLLMSRSVLKAKELAQLVKCSVTEKSTNNVDLLMRCTETWRWRPRFTDSQAS